MRVAIKIHFMPDPYPGMLRTGPMCRMRGRQAAERGGAPIRSTWLNTIAAAIGRLANWRRGDPCHFRASTLAGEGVKGAACGDRKPSSAHPPRDKAQAVLLEPMP
jgi:hypothetical protein